jgi:hypothetical protein
MGDGTDEAKEQAMTIRRAGLGTTALVGVAALVTVLTATPAAAAKVTVPDPTGDSGQGVDLVALDVRHSTINTPNRLVLRARHTGLPDFDSGVFTTVTFWIDVDRADRGPEFVVDVIPNAGGMRLLAVEGWGRADKRVQPCPGMRARADVFTDGPVRLSVPRSCIDDPARVRGAVKAVGETPQGEVVGRDWVGGRRHWSPWVRS